MLRKLIRVGLICSMLLLLSSCKDRDLDSNDLLITYSIDSILENNPSLIPFSEVLEKYLEIPPEIDQQILGLVTYNSYVMEDDQSYLLIKSLCRKSEYFFVYTDFYKYVFLEKNLKYNDSLKSKWKIVLSPILNMGVYNISDHPFFIQLNKLIYFESACDSSKGILEEWPRLFRIRGIDEKMRYFYFFKEKSKDEILDFILMHYKYSDQSEEYAIIRSFVLSNSDRISKVLEIGSGLILILNNKNFIEAYFIPRTLRIIGLEL